MTKIWSKDTQRRTKAVPSIYRKQQKLSWRKVLRFSQIFDDSRKFSLLIDIRRTVDIIMEANSQRFSHKSYQTTKLFSHLSFVIYGNQGCSHCISWGALQKFGRENRAHIGPLQEPHYTMCQPIPFGFYHKRVIHNQV